MSNTRLLFAIATLGWLITLGSGKGLAQQEWQDNLFNDPNFPNQLGSSPLARFNDAYHNHNYEEAATYLPELLKESPSSLSLLHQAIDVYHTLAERTEDLPLKLQYANSLMAVYEKRLHPTGDTVQTLNRKLNDVYKLLYQHPQFHSELFRLFRSDTQRLGQQVAYYNMIPYAITACQLYRSGKLDREGVLQTKQMLEGIVKMHQKGPQQEDYQKAGVSMQKIFNALES